MPPSSRRQSRAPSTSSSGGPSGTSNGACALVEEEDRLELRLRRVQEAQPSLLRSAMRPLVRQHGSVLVRLDAERGDDARARARDAVGADVVLRQRPEGRLLGREDAVLAPRAQVAAGLLLGVGQRQVDDVVRASREVLLALLGADHVVRRRDEALERAGPVGVVAKRAKRLDLGHSAGTVPSVSGPRLGTCLRSPSWSRTASSRASTRSRRRSDCARAGALRTSPSSSSTRAGGSRRASGATSTCWTAASTRATPCASSAGSTASATGCSSRSARSSRPRTSIRPRSRRPCAATPTSSRASSSSSPARSRTPA